MANRTTSINATKRISANKIRRTAAAAETQANIARVTAALAAAGATTTPTPPPATGPATP